MSVEAKPPPNFWGDMPEDEFYASQGVRNTQQYFKTPHGNVFTQSWMPLEGGGGGGRIKGLVCVTHGYGGETGWLFQRIAIAFAQAGYAVFGADLLGHGRSDGIPCYIGDMNKAAAASLHCFKSARDSEAYKGLPHFLFGESMGGAVTLLMYFQDPQGWDGIILACPLIVLPEATKPSWWHLTAYGLLFGLADTWPVMPDPRLLGLAIKDPKKLKIMANNPRRYTGKPRVGTMREVTRVSAYLQETVHKLTIPFLTCHGTADIVTDPESSRLLFEKAQSNDKTIKLYDGMYHSLVQGETDENFNIVFNDMREWTDARALKFPQSAEEVAGC